jgi:UDP-glucose 4-epimerase
MDTKYTKALVTGGAGFIGSHIVDALVARRYKTYVVDNLSRGKKENLNPNAQFFKMDITSPEFPKLIQKLKPDVIFHVAAQIDVRKSVVAPITDAKINIFATLALAEAAAAAGVKKIIFSSSGGAMFSDDVRPPYSEEAREQPVSPYGITKRAGELYLNFEQKNRGLSCVSLRYSNVYGPRQSSVGDAGVVAIFSEKMLAGLQAKINGNGKQTRDYVYVGDVVRANLLAMNEKINGIFNIGTGRETSVNDLFGKLKKIIGYQLPEKHVPACSGEVMRSSLICKKAAKVLGWQPKVKLDDGLKKTVEWFRRATLTPHRRRAMVGAANPSPRGRGGKSLV